MLKSFSAKCWKPTDFCEPRVMHMSQSRRYATRARLIVDCQIRLLLQVLESRPCLQLSVSLCRQRG